MSQVSVDSARRLLQACSQHILDATLQQRSYPALSHTSSKPPLASLDEQPSGSLDAEHLSEVRSAILRGHSYPPVSPTDPLPPCAVHQPPIIKQYTPEQIIIAIQQGHSYPQDPHTGPPPPQALHRPPIIRPYSPQDKAVTPEAVLKLDTLSKHTPTEKHDSSQEVRVPVESTHPRGPPGGGLSASLVHEVVQHLRGCIPADTNMRPEPLSDRGICIAFGPPPEDVILGTPSTVVALVISDCKLPDPIQRTVC